MSEKPETEYEREIAPEDAGVLGVISRAEIDVQISTAKKYPRSIDAFRKQLFAIATLDEATAASMFYRLPRDGKVLEGPSVRLAEAAVSSWGNLHVAARIVAEDERFVTAQALAWDVEKNVRIGIEVRRRITNKFGKRFSDDMVGVTGNAAISIALRNAVFKVVPAALMKPALEQAKQVALGKGLTMVQRQEQTIKDLAALGAKPEQIFVVLGRRGAADLTIDDLLTLKGFKTAIEDGETTWQQIMDEAARAAAERVDNVRAPGEIIREAERKGAEAKPDAAGGANASGASGAPDVVLASAPTAVRSETENIDEFQASIDPLTPEQRQALIKTIGSARLSPAKVRELCARFQVGEITQINFGQYKQLLEMLAENAKSATAPTEQGDGKLFG